LQVRIDPGFWFLDSGYWILEFTISVLIDIQHQESGIQHRFILLHQTE
jgi:hypothetical protein